MDHRLETMVEDPDPIKIRSFFDDPDPNPDTIKNRSDPDPFATQKKVLISMLKPYLPTPL